MTGKDPASTACSCSPGRGPAWIGLVNGERIMIIRRDLRIYLRTDSRTRSSGIRAATMMFERMAISESLVRKGI